MTDYEVFKDDWKDDPLVEDVRVYGPLDEEKQTPVPDVKARKGDQSFRDTGGPISLQSGETLWIVFADTLRGTVIEPGSRFEQRTGEVWTVFRSALVVAGTRYFCAAMLEARGE